MQDDFGGVFVLACLDTRGGGSDRGHVSSSIFFNSTWTLHIHIHAHVRPLLAGWC